MADPESTRVPSLSGNSNSPNHRTDQYSTLPMVAIDRGTSANEKDRSVASSSLMSVPKVDPQLVPNTLPAPSQTSPPAYANVKPLIAPQDFDSQPRWNASLLDPDDRTVLEKSDMAVQQDKPVKSTPVREAVVRRIRLVEDSAVTNAVATDSSTDFSNKVQLTGGFQAKTGASNTANEDAQPSFRPVTKLK